MQNAGHCPGHLQSVKRPVWVGGVAGKGGLHFSAESWGRHHYQLPLAFPHPPTCIPV